jgi:regulator of cell morphogenesis and NO signaling
MPTSKQTIRDIVATHATAFAVLKCFEIDLCSHANEPLDEACSKLQLSVDQVIEKLEDAVARESEEVLQDPTSLSISHLIQHIVRVHHMRVRQELPRLAEMAHKLAVKHGDHAPELEKVDSLVEDLRGEMTVHIEKEEHILFPFISQMDEGLPVRCSPEQACFSSVRQPIRMMMREHDSANKILAKLHTMTNGFESPDWACPTHLALYAGLRAFESGLKQHEYLENDVLFPRAIEIEATMNTQAKAK